MYEYYTQQASQEYTDYTDYAIQTQHTAAPTYYPAYTTPMSYGFTNFETPTSNNILSQSTYSPIPHSSPTGLAIQANTSNGAYAAYPNQHYLTATPNNHQQISALNNSTPSPSQSSQSTTVELMHTPIAYACPVYASPNGIPYAMNVAAVQMTATSTATPLNSTISSNTPQYISLSQQQSCTETPNSTPLSSQGSVCNANTNTSILNTININNINNNANTCKSIEANMFSTENINNKENRMPHKTHKSKRTNNSNNNSFYNNNNNNNNSSRRTNRPQTTYKACKIENDYNMLSDEIKQNEASPSFSQNIPSSQELNSQYAPSSQSSNSQYASSSQLPSSQEQQPCSQQQQQQFFRDYNENANINMNQYNTNNMNSPQLQHQMRIMQPMHVAPLPVQTNCCYESDNSFYNYTNSNDAFINTLTPQQNFQPTYSQNYSQNSVDYSNMKCEQVDYQNMKCEQTDYQNMKCESVDKSLNTPISLNNNQDEGVICNICRGRRKCFCYFIKVRYFKFPSYLDMVDYQYKNWRQNVKARKM